MAPSPWGEGRGEGELDRRQNRISEMQSLATHRNCRGTCFSVAVTGASRLRCSETTNEDVDKDIRDEIFHHHTQLAQFCLAQALSGIGRGPGGSGGAYCAV